MVIVMYTNVFKYPNGLLFFSKIIALLYAFKHTCCIHIIVNSNNRIHEEEIQIQLMMMIGFLEWVVILFSPFRCFIIPFLCSQHAIKFFDFSFSLCISVTRALVNIIFKHVQFLFRYWKCLLAWFERVMFWCDSISKIIYA